jgi:hypothetical protein
MKESFKDTEDFRDLEEAFSAIEEARGATALPSPRRGHPSRDVPDAN